MNVNDIVYLKSSNEKLMITWIVDVTQNPSFPIDVNKTLTMRPDYQIGDIAVKYGKDKKATIPGKCLIDTLVNRIPAADQNLTVGSVVKHRLTDEEMTVTWIIGQGQLSTGPFNFNDLCKRQGFNDGDIVCGYFEKKEYKTHLFKAHEVVKIYE